MLLVSEKTKRKKKKKKIKTDKINSIYITTSDNYHEFHVDQVEKVNLEKPNTFHVHEVENL